MTGVERKRRRIKQEEEEAFTTLWIYLEHRLSFFFFLFDWGFGVYVLSTTIVLTRDSTRRVDAGFILKKLVSKKVNIHFHPYLMLCTPFMSIHPLAP
jgi:hypothetical protein